MAKIDISKYEIVEDDELEPVKAQPTTNVLQSKTPRIDLNKYEVVDDEGIPTSITSLKSGPDKRPPSPYDKYELAESSNTPEDFFGSFLTGLKTELAPTTVSTEEYTKDRTIKELVGQVTGNLTGIIAASYASAKAGAAIGGAVGSVVPGAGTIAGMSLGAVGGLVGYGVYNLYRSIGEEDLRSRAAGQEFNLARAGANFALNINPMIAANSKTAKGLRIVAQGAGQAGVEAWYGNNATGVGVAAAAGMLGMAFVPIAAVKQTPAMIKDTGDFLVDSKHNILTKTLKRMDDEFKPISINLEDAKVNQQLEGVTSSLDKKFKQYIVGKPLKDTALDEAVVQKLDKLNSQGLNDIWEDFNWNKIQLEETSEVARKLETDVAGLSEGLLPGVRWLQSMRTVSKRVDDQIGIGLEDTLDALAESSITYRNSVGGTINKAAKTMEAMKKAKIDKVKVGRMLSGVDEITEEYRPFVEAFRSYYDDLGSMIKGAGFDLKNRKDYMNMMSYDAPDMYNLLNGSYKKLKGLVDGEDLFNLSKEAKKKIQSEGLYDEFKDFVSAIRHYGGDSVTSDKQVMSTLRSLVDGKKAGGSGKEVSALFERTGEIPERWRDFDVGKNLIRYANANVKSGFYHRALRDLDTKIEALEQVGLTQTTDYFRKYKAHMLGFDHETAFMGDFNAKLLQRKQMWRAAAGYVPGAGKPLPKAEKLLDFVNWSTQLAYPNLLGANSFATIRNLMQHPLMTVPELGLNKTSFSAGFQGWQAIRKAPSLDKMGKFLNANGLAADAETLQGGQTLLTDILRQNSKYLNSVKKTGDFFMYFYNKTDTINRYVTYHTGKALGKQLASPKTQADALKAVKRLGAATQARVSHALSKGNYEEAGDIIGRKLIGITQFHYGPEQMHELGRMGGRLFSMFSKWPTEIGSAMAYNVAKGDGEWTKNVSKFIAPWLGLYAIQQGREATFGSDLRDEPGFTKYLLGKNLTGAAPAQAIASNVFDLSGNIMIESALKLGALPYQVAQGKLSDAPDKIMKTLYSTLSPFAPVPGLPMINELNRFNKAHGGKPFEDVVRDTLTGKQSLREAERQIMNFPKR